MARFYVRRRASASEQGRLVTERVLRVGLDAQRTRTDNVRPPALLSLKSALLMTLVIRRCKGCARTSAPLAAQ